jgi:hypothetical protein
MRHQANDHSAHYRYDRHEPVVQCRTRRTDHSEAEPVEIKQVGCERYRTKQQNGQPRCARADNQRYRREQPHAPVDSEISQC